VRTVGAEVIEGIAFLDNGTKVSGRCHKNVVVLSDSRAKDLFSAAPKADISNREEH
jgi:hypothetical protein